MSNEHFVLSYESLMSGLRRLVGDESSVISGIPINCTAKGTKYHTRVMAIPLHMIGSESDIHFIIFQMVKCAIRPDSGDSIVIRSLEANLEENGDSFLLHIWLRVCKEDSSLPDIYEKKSDGYGLINE